VLVELRNHRRGGVRDQPLDCRSRDDDHAARAKRVRDNMQA
jgi:hypothetical protein